MILVNGHADRGHGSTVFCGTWYMNVFVWVGIGLYNKGMETLPGPEIKVKACHSLNNNYKHKRTADNHVNPDIDST